MGSNRIAFPGALVGAAAGVGADALGVGGVMTGFMTALLFISTLRLHYLPTISPASTFWLPFKPIAKLST
jgi:hypothetical protein